MLSRLVEKAIDGHLEGDAGLEILESLFKRLGYKNDGFRFGTPIENFLSDNPGAQEALVTWVGEQNIPEWIEALKSDEDEDEEDEEYLQGRLGRFNG